MVETAVGDTAMIDRRRRTMTTMYMIGQRLPRTRTEVVMSDSLGQRMVTTIAQRVMACGLVILRSRHRTTDIRRRRTMIVAMIGHTMIGSTTTIPTALSSRISSIGNLRISIGMVLRLEIMALQLAMADRLPQFLRSRLGNILVVARIK